MKKLYFIILLVVFTIPSCTLISYRWSPKKTIKNYQELHTENKIEVDVIEKYDTPLYSDEISSKGKFNSLIHEETILKLSKTGYLDSYFLWPQKKSIALYLDYTVALAIVGFTGYLFSKDFQFTFEKLGGVSAGGMIIGVAESLKYKSAKKTILPNSLFKQVLHPEGLKYMSFSEVKVDAKNISTSKYKPTLKYGKHKHIKNKESNTNLKQKYSTQKINSILYKGGYFDTINILSSDLNKLTIDATIYEQNTIRLKKLDDIAKYEFKIRYDFRESFTDSIIYTHKDSIVTDFHYIDSKYKSELINQSVIKGFYKLVDNAEEIEPLLKQEFEEKNTSPIQINVDSVAHFYGEAIAACVTVKVDKGHGSGFFISNDGYIITNLHVVGNTNKIEVILNNGDQMNAELIRKSIKHDLALLKVDSYSDVCIKLDQKEKQEITDHVGEKIYVIGTPNNLQLGQSVSRGIVSGYRNYQDVKYYQTDASINGGNSGGPMILESGEVLGIVNAKLVGSNIERIGFAIPSNYVFEALNLFYQ